MTASPIELLLRDLQSAVSVCHLYPREHPRLVELITRAVALVDEVAARGEVAIFCVDGRLVVDGRVLPGGDHLARGIFVTLQKAGFHRLGLGKGLQASELYVFVERLARARKAGPEVKILPSEHIRLAALEEAPREVGGVGTGQVSADFQPLVNVWNGIVDERRCDLDALEYIVLALARTIDRHAESILPLASLRHHDDYTVMHITNVAMLAMALAEAVGLPLSTVNDIGIAALLHDIGKLRVPAEILNAPGRLSEEQAAVVKRHPEEGARILLATPGAPDLAVVVAYEHHIQFDGGGYPTVPRRWRLNLASAITTVADVYDALRSDRPYRVGMPPDRIHAIMTKESGTVFDPALLKAFFEFVVPRAVVTERPVAPPPESTPSADAGGTPAVVASPSPSAA